MGLEDLIDLDFPLEIYLEGGCSPPLLVLAIAWPPAVPLQETALGVGDWAVRDGLLTFRS